MTRTIHYDELASLKELFVGKSVKKVDDETLELSDGQQIKLVGNSGCCSFYELTKLNGCENIITNVDVYADPDFLYDDDKLPHDGVFRLFVFTENEQITLAEFEGTDSSGYYGTGFWIEVQR